MFVAERVCHVETYTLYESLIWRGENMTNLLEELLSVPVFKTNKVVEAAAKYLVDWACHVNKGLTDTQLSVFRAELMKKLGKPMDDDLEHRDGGAWGDNSERTRLIKDALDVAGIPYFNPGVLVGVSITSRFSDPRKLTVQATYPGCSFLIAEVVEDF